MASTVYTTDSIESPTAVQQEFTNHYDMANPMDAIQDYAKMMHLHTKRQMENATQVARRRGSSGTGYSSLETESSTESMTSVDSNAS